MTRQPNHSMIFALPMVSAALVALPFALFLPGNWCLLGFVPWALTVAIGSWLILSRTAA
jgi:hypothetical protein